MVPSCSGNRQLLHLRQLTPVPVENATKSARAVRGAQVRGSIPLYWGQDAASMSPMNPKPAIQLQQNDPHFTATRLHFQVPPCNPYLCAWRAALRHAPALPGAAPRPLPLCLACRASLPAIEPCSLLTRSSVLAPNTGCKKSRWDVCDGLLV